MGVKPSSLEIMELELKNYYQGKKILVTGHTGFKGSWLSIWLKYLGAEVIGYALAPKTKQDNFCLSGLEKELHHIEGDIRDAGNLKRVVDEVKPDVVFHLAAQPIVGESYANPGETYDVNVMGTLNVLDAIRHQPSVKSGIMITSDKCYENKEWSWGYRENDEMGGHDPYSSSKACCEILISSYSRSFFKDDNQVIASVRAGNVIGGGDWNDGRIVPDCIRAIEKGDAIELRSPLSTRPWQHVLEPLSGYLLLGAKITTDPSRYCGSWNFGPSMDDIQTVEKLVETVIKNLGSGEWKDLSDRQVYHEANLLALDVSKARHQLDWKPNWHFEEAIAKTVEWYRDREKGSVYELCLKQIKEYMN